MLLYVQQFVQFEFEEAKERKGRPAKSEEERKKGGGMHLHTFDFCSQTFVFFVFRLFVFHSFHDDGFCFPDEASKIV